MPYASYTSGIIPAVSWHTETTAEFDDWFDGLRPAKQDRVIAAVELLEGRGPGLGRPFVDSIAGSRHQNMKELRVGTMRILFAFDPDRTAVLLVGGDKRDQWKSWYRKAIKRADELLDQHLR